MKTLFISTASILFAAPVLAGPYVNVESNSGFSSGDYTSTLVEKHVGYEGELGESATLVEKHVGYEGELGESATWYVQGGPALEFTDASGTESKVSGKVGATVALTEKVDAYGEFAVVSDDSWDISESNLGLKAGFIYTF